MSGRLLASDAEADAAEAEAECEREIEELREALSVTQRALDAAASQRRHWIRITCDRCGAQLEISSTLAMGDLQLATAMRRSAEAIGWTLSSATHGALGGDGKWFGCPDRDLCLACSNALNMPRHGGA